jgi:hypothetical protein
MIAAHFVLNAVSDRPYTEGRRIARERVISRSRAYRQLVLCNKIKQNRSNEFRQTQMFCKTRKLLPKWWQTTAFSKMNAEQEHISELAGSILNDDMNKPYQVTLFELDNHLNGCD